MFIPTRDLFLFVSTGRDTKMYTLRVLQEGKVVTQKGSYITQQSQYITNLSTNLKEALEKAQDAAVRQGIPFSSEYSSSDDLYEIIRYKAEAQRISEEEARLAVEADLQAKLEEKHNLALQWVKDYGQLDMFPFGAYKDTKFSIAKVAKLDPNYINFLLDTYQPLEEGQFYINFNHAFVDLMIRPNFDYTTLPESQHVGEVKERLRDVRVVCERVTGFLGESHIGQYWVDRYIVRDQDGNKYIIDYTGTSWEMEPLNEYVITGTVKRHLESDRFGKSTALTRVVSKTLKEYDESTVKAPKSRKAPQKRSEKVGGESKMDRARRIFANNPDASRKEMLEMFQNELEMSPAGASTYYQKINKESQNEG